MSQTNRTYRGRDVLALVGIVAICYVPALIGYIASPEMGGAWYDALAKPDWTPPPWTFGTAWTALYAMMGLAAWLVWRCRDRANVRPALIAFGVQLALNAAWTPLFFGAHLIGAAFVELLVLLAAVVVTVVLFSRIRAMGTWLLVPYVGWLVFAALLNYAIWQMNM
ncbi:MAG: TspO/MBR family protein [Planctomycetota bacterium]